MTEALPAAADMSAALVAPRPRRGPHPLLRRALLTLAGVLVLMLVWEAYKAVGPAAGVRVAGTLVLPRTDDGDMPHVWTTAAELLRPISSLPGSTTVGAAVLAASVTTLAIAAQGFAIGLVAGAALALLMARFRIAERGLLPWIVLSQTVPLIALAPLVVIWGSALPGWTSWSSVAVIAAYLAFFPVSVGLLRGLESPEAVHRDLFDAQGAGWWRTLIHLRLPASVPFLLPALRLAAASAVVGTVVAEVSTGTDGGIGRTILAFAVQSTGNPARPWAAVLGAVAVGLVTAALVAAAGRLLLRFRRAEATA
ncbi:ABC transporter permease [uncultured Amnibacterium sp.]|uniref:ABC transporter permease n=1 Tax=uncultured Amnibacterium sp. TaxID=1631851 RepID=UPI0035CAE368